MGPFLWNDSIKGFDSHASLSLFQYQPKDDIFQESAEVFHMLDVEEVIATCKSLEREMGYAFRDEKQPYLSKRPNVLLNYLCLRFFSYAWIVATPVRVGNVPFTIEESCDIVPIHVSYYRNQHYIILLRSI